MRNDSGTSLLEYSMLVALLAIASIGILSSYANAIVNIFNTERITAEAAAGGIVGDCDRSNPAYPNC